MNAVSFGEVLWDIIEEAEYLGGAPFNLAAHLAALGCQSAIITRIGEDERGRRVTDEMGALEVDPVYAQIDKKHHTGTVNVTLSLTGEPTFVINKNAAYDFIEAEEGLLKSIAKEPLDVFCYGTLAQRGEVSRNALLKLFEVVKPGHFFFDVNLRQQYYNREIITKSLSMAGIVKLNDEEVAVLSKLLYNKDMGEKDFSAELCKNFPVKIVCVTRGENGCAVYHNNEFKEMDGIKVKVIDTVGSGDAFSAGFLQQFCAGKDPFEAAVFANKLGAFVASKRGAIPEHSDEIKKLLGQ